MNHSSERQAAIVTGGASGIGEAITRRFTADGANVIIVDIDENKGNALAEELEHSIFLPLDVAESSNCDRMVKEAMDRYGRLDTLVNNAFWTKANRIRKLSDDNWRRSIQVTQDAVFFGIRAAFTVMLRQGYGSIINTASICGLGGDDGMSPYNAAKAAVINMTRSAALEAAEHGVRVNCICPGLIETPAVRRAYLRNEALESHIAAQVPMRRLGQPEDIAKAAAFLASEEAAYVTGAALVVDGGQSIHSGVPDLGL